MRTARPRTAHPALWAGCAALAAGAVLCVIGWYGVSGERFAERQLPYLASCTVPGAALIVAGAVLLAVSRVERRYEPPAMASPDPAPSEAVPPLASSDRLLRVPGGTLWHRADCPLVEGKPQAAPVGPGDTELAPCPICEPPATS
ncbi:hypothetical protein ABZY90_24860 [Streptomyces sp. NPDC006422]|uniref:hypothetical protein n=1 Tax=unclassified Streptomyces TaxID=2593676 RepID=UPI0033B4D0E8